MIAGKVRVRIGEGQSPSPYGNAKGFEHPSLIKRRASNELRRKAFHIYPHRLLPFALLGQLIAHTAVLYICRVSALPVGP